MEREPAGAEGPKDLGLEARMGKIKVETKGLDDGKVIAKGL